MTAISAQSASETPSTADRTVLLPGSPATYTNRAYLRGLGLRWDPERHQWHGTTTAEHVQAMRVHLGLEVRCFGTLEPPRGPSPPRPPARVASIATGEVRDHAPARRLHDGSRTCAEARVAHRDGNEDAEEIATPTRRFSLLEITSGLPDDSREADERQEERRLRDLRARVKVARAVVSTAPGLAEILSTDWQKASRFYARFGVTEEWLRRGVARSEVPDANHREWGQGLVHRFAECCPETDAVL
jgi:hypothetical protein